jgi:hypothetical protein
MGSHAGCIQPAAHQHHHQPYAAEEGIKSSMNVSQVQVVYVTAALQPRVLLNMSEAKQHMKGILLAT